MGFKVVKYRAVIATVAFVLAGCANAEQLNTPTASPSSDVIDSISVAPSPETKSSPPTPTATPTAVVAMTQRANERVCGKFQDTLVETGVGDLITQYETDSSKVPFTQLQSFAGRIDGFPTTNSSPEVEAAAKAFLSSAGALYKAGAKKPELDRFLDSYKNTQRACAPFTTAKPFTFSINCTVDGKSAAFSDFRAAWPSRPNSCEASLVSGTELSELEQHALTAAHYDDPKSLKTLYGLCSQIGGYPADISNFTSGRLGETQVYEAEGMLTLCPDHPDSSKIRENIDQAGLVAAASSSFASAEADGRVAKPGKHVVGTDIKPGSWQTVGDRTEDCYWELTDASGKILDNSFVSVAPKVSINISAEVVGFTNSGCTFEWTGP